MNKKAIITERAPAAIGPYFQAVNQVRPVLQRALFRAQHLSGGSVAIGCEDRSEAILEL